MARRPIVAVLVAVVALYALLHVLLILPAERLGFDALCYFLAAQALTLGQSPFVETNYLYPPFLAVVLMPTLSLGMQAALLGWIGLMAATTVGLLLGLRQIVGWRVALVAVLLFPPVWTSLVVGQVNAMIGWFGALALLDLEARRSRAGVWLALGALIKVTPVIVFAAMLMQRRLRVIVVGAALGILAVAVSLPIAGWQTWIEGVRVASQAVDPANPVVLHYNISLAGAAEYWLGLSSAAAIFPAIGLTLMFWRIPRLAMDRAFAACILVPLLVGRIAWMYHVVIALPALAVLWRAGGRDRWVAVACWAVVALLTDRVVPTLNLVATLAILVAWAACLWPQGAAVVAQVPAPSSRRVPWLQAVNMLRQQR